MPTPCLSAIIFSFYLSNFLIVKSKFISIINLLTINFCFNKLIFFLNHQLIHTLHYKMFRNILLKSNLVTSPSIFKISVNQR